LILRSIGPVVWLTADEDAIWERVSRNRNRPLLQTADPRATIHDLMQVRYPLYREAADIIVETSILTHQEVATRILLALRSWVTKGHEEQH
jgi:shikimate kinase